MPILDILDATDVDDHIERTFEASTSHDRENALRLLFTETMDFVCTTGSISLENARNGVTVSGEVKRMWSLDSVSVVPIIRPNPMPHFDLFSIEMKLAS